MLEKAQQDVGSLFKILLISTLIFLGACSSRGPMDKNIIVHNNDAPVKSVYEFAWKLMEDVRWNLPNSATQMHNQAIVTALTRASNGEKVEWIDTYSNSRGYSKVLVTAPSSGGWCRMTETSAEYKGRKRIWVYNACTVHGSEWDIKIEATHG